MHTNISAQLLLVCNFTYYYGTFVIFFLVANECIQTIFKRYLRIFEIKGIKVIAPNPAKVSGFFYYRPTSYLNAVSCSVQLCILAISVNKK